MSDSDLEHSPSIWPTETGPRSNLEMTTHTPQGRKKEKEDLFNAVRNHRYFIVESMLRTNVSLVETNNDDDTVLHVAAREENLQILNILLQKAPSYAVLKPNKKDESPLSIAVQKGDVNMCKLLCEVQQDEQHVKQMANKLKSLLDLAVRQDHSEVVEYLLQHYDYLQTNSRQSADNNANTTLPSDMKSDTGDTFLHIAAQNGSAQTAKMLIKKHQRLVNLQNNKGDLPLHKAVCAAKFKIVQLILKEYAEDENLWNTFTEKTLEMPNVMVKAIKTGQEEIVALFIEHCHWEKFVLVEKQTHNEETPMQHLILHMPNMACKVLDRGWQPKPESKSKAADDKDGQHVPDSRVAADDKDEQHESIIAKYELLEEGKQTNNADISCPDISCPDMSCPNPPEKSSLRKGHALQMIANTNATQLMDHPLTKSLLRRKWKRAFAVYFCFLSFYLLYLALITTLMFKSKPLFHNQTCENTSSSGSSVPPANIGLSAAVYVFAVIGLVLEIIQLGLIGFNHYMNINNFVDWCTYICPFIVFATSRSCGELTDWQWQVGVACLFVGYINMLFFLRIVPVLGIYIMLVTLMLKNLLQFFLIMFLFLLSFGICFYLLLQNQVSFSNLGFSVMKTYTMMLNDVDFAGIFMGQLESDDEDVALHYPVMVWLLYIAFLVFISLVMLNLLTSLAVHGVENLKKDSKHKILALQINLALDVEFALPTKLKETLTFEDTSEPFVLPEPKVNQCVACFISCTEKLLYGSLLCKKDIIEQAQKIVETRRSVAFEEQIATEQFNIKDVRNCIKQQIRPLKTKINAIKKDLISINKTIEKNLCHQ